MVKFGKKLLESQYTPWNEHYVDYKRLKKILNKKPFKAKTYDVNVIGIGNKNATIITRNDEEKEVALVLPQDGGGQKIIIEPVNSNIQDTSKDDNYFNNNTFQFTLTKECGKGNKNGNDEDDEEIQNNKNSNITNEEIQLIFRRSLDREIENVVLFFLQEQGEIARKLSFLSMQHQLHPSSSLSSSSSSSSSSTSISNLDLISTQNLILKYNEIGEDILRLIHFVELNVMAVRKILKKHDKLYKGNKISNLYLSKSFMDGYDSHLEQLYDYSGIAAIVASLKIGFYELGCHLRHLEFRSADSDRFGYHDDDVDHHHVQNDNSTNYSSLAQYLRGGSNSNINPNPPSSPSRYLTKSKSSTLVSSTSSSNTMGVVPPLSSYFNKQREEPILVRIEIARRALHRSKEYVDILAAQLMIDDDETDDDFSERNLAQKDAEKEWAKTKYQQISSFLNLFSTFLYMTNYYIVAPTCGPYAEELGSSSAMGGIIIGMTPLAALVASILYGWWSNYSYKSALLFASFCCIMGDLLYALALHYQSLHMVIIGRYLNGFGSARAINRRYIADTFSRRERTAASAAFVTAGALGMAFGPATAAALGRLSYSGDMITVYTSPGWVMCILWVIYFLLTWIFFEDPACQKDKLARKAAKTLSGTSISLSLAHGSHDEKKALMSHNKNNESSKSKRAKLQPLWKNVPVMSTLWNYFVLKLVLESLLSSSAMLTSHCFNWNMTLSGSLLAVLGLLMFPANLVVAKLSREYDEREMIMGNFYLILFGVIGILSYWSETYTAVQYVFFAICIFLGTNALEGPNMSLLSKTIPLAWAKGTFNSGLLATEAGTFGRVVGDGFVSIVSFVSSDDDFLLNGIYLPILGLILVTVFAMTRLYPFLEPKDDDDDDDDTDDDSTS